MWHIAFSFKVILKGVISKIKKSNHCWLLSKNILILYLKCFKSRKHKVTFNFCIFIAVASMYCIFAKRGGI
jgi:hypothetical protein